MASKNKNRSGFLFMFIVIILLLIIVYAYRDKFIIFFKTGIFQSDKFSKIDFKDIFAFKNKNEKNKNNVIEKIKLIEKKENFNPKNQKHRTKYEEKDLVMDKNLNKTEKNDILTKKEDNKEIRIEKNEVTMNKKQEKVKKEIKNESNNIELKKRISKIYFTMLDEKDQLILKSVNREIFYYNTPLTETIKELLKGPNITELQNNYITNIPFGSKILKAWIKDDILYLDLSREFENNNYGKESTLNQLKQIVFTATEFPNVKRVKFLINGKDQNYLGGEGVFIGKPLGRFDF